MQHSKDADKILALPAARHPKLIGFARALAEDPLITLSRADTLLDAAAKSANVTTLAIEMCQPGASVHVPFAAVAPRQDARSDFVAGVERELNRINQSKRGRNDQSR